MRSIHFADHLEKKVEENRGCPCMYLEEPCHPHCTCRNGLYSTGCMFCCRYGSMDQRKAKAEQIADKLRQ